MRKRVLSLITAICMLCGLALNGHVLPVSAEETPTPTVYVEQNFDDMEVGTIPTGWSYNGTEAEADAGKTTMTVAQDGDTNKVAIYKQDVSQGDRSGEYDMKYSFEAADQVVLEYKYKTSKRGLAAYLPVLTYADGTFPVALQTYEGYVDGSTSTTTQRVSFKDSRGGTKLANSVALAEKTWHTVKEIVDLKNGVCELYMDGKKVAISTFTPKAQKLSSVTVAIYRTNSGTVYFDDLSVKTYVPATGVTFGVTSLTLQEGTTKTLAPTFAPADASVQSVTYASSNTDVATVDANGVVTAVSAGAATITATPDAAGLDPVTISVTVTGIPSLPFVVDFNDVEEGATPTGWSLRIAEKDADIADTENYPQTTYIVEADTDDTTNRVAKLAQTAKRTGGYEVQYSFEPESAVVLEYKYKQAGNSSVVFMPVLTYEDGKTYPTTLQTVGAASGFNVGICKTRHNTKLYNVNLTTNEWHTVKQIVDLDNGVYEWFFDGVRVDTGSDVVNVVANSKLSAVTFGFWNSSTGTIYIDDLSVKAFDAYAGTVDELKAAIAAGQSVIVLTDNITLEEKITITSDVKLVAGEAVTITTGSVVDAFTVDANGVLTLGENVSVSCVRGAFWVQNGGKLVIDGASITQSGGDYVPAAATGTGSVIEVKSGSVASESSSAIAALNGSVVNISGGTVTSSQAFAAYATGGATINVSGGTVTNGVADKAALIAAKFTESTGGNVNVTGGTVKGVLAHEAATATATISGGNITGPVSTSNGATMIITGGTFTDTTNVSQYLAAGSKLVDGTVVAIEPPDIPFTVDFEDGEHPVSGLPIGWKLRNTEKDGQAGKTTSKIVTDPADENNQVLEMTQTESRSGWYLMQYDFEPTDQAVIFEYRYRVASGTGIVYMPSLAYNTTGGTPQWPLVMYTSSGSVYYSKYLTDWKNAGSLAFNEWHTIKQVIDPVNKLCVLYLDGKLINLDANQYRFLENGEKLSGITMFFDAGATGTIYFDDFKVSFATTATGLDFEEKSVEVPVNGKKQLIPKFDPRDASVQAITYASSDEAVAIVDEAGVVTGISEGTATITATSALSYLEPVTITVTVEGKVQGSVEVAKTEMALPTGGHEYLDARLVLNEGYMADETLVFASSAPGVVTVDEYGEVLAVGAGTATITISAEVNAEIYKEVTVTVTDPTVMKTIYVAPNGTGDGTSAANATTLEGALAILEGINKADMTGNIEVILADGYYYRTETLALTEKHGGSNLYSVVFKAEAENATPTIGGGIFIDGSKFTESTEIEGAYVLDLSTLGYGTIATRQMFVNNVRATRARGAVAPVNGTALINAEYLFDTDGTTRIGFICDNTELLDLARPQDLELVSNNSWVNSRCQVSRIEEVDGRVYLYMDMPGFYYVGRGASYIAMAGDNIVYYENALELLDEAGEWYLNEDTQKLYYMPRAWETMANVTVTLPIFDNWDKDDSGETGLVTIIGSSSDQQVQNIRFEGITFADTTWTRPSDENHAHGTVQNNYLRDLDNGGYNQGLGDAAVTVRKANSVSFLDCTFTRLGFNAINMWEGVQNSLIQGNHFYDISGGAISIGQPDYIYDVDNYNPTDVNKMMKNDDVLNNYIHDTGVDFKGAAAISVGFGVNLDLCHNEIFHIPYSGFHIGYGWETSKEIYTKNLNVSENFIHDYMWDGIYDGGAIYTNGPTGGDEDHWNIISRNYAKNQGEKVGPYYSDTGSSWWKYTENVAELTITTGEHSGAKLRSFYSAIDSNDNWFTGNYSTIDNTFGEDPLERVVFENNTVVEDGNWPAEALAIIAAAGLEDSYSGLRNGQVERIVTAASDEGVELSVEETFNLAVSGTDGKDNAVSMANAIVTYESLDEAVATVDENGVIEAVGNGQTTVRVSVVSNGVLDVVEIAVIVGDKVAEIHLKDVESEITLSETSREQQLVAYGVTESGREVSFDTVTWSTDDETVAKVDANGILKPVGPGETTLTVIGEKGGVTKTTTCKIIVKQTIVAEVDYLEDIFKAENADNWVSSSNPSSWTAPLHWTLEDGERITTTIKTWRLYTGKTYQNELLTFRMSLKDVGGWPSIILRCQSTTGNVATGATGYIICMGTTGIELHRFNGTTRTQFYGPVANPAPLVGPSITPNPLNDNEFHEIQVGAINEEGGVRLVMYIDGEEIFNVLDTGEDAIWDAGYFGIRGATADEFVLENAKVEVDYLEDIFKAENADNWVSSSNPSSWTAPLHWTLEDGERITTTIKTWRLYTGKTYQNELLTFRMSLKDVGNWPSIILRCQSATTGNVGTGATGYLICMPDEGIELHRFNGTTRTQWYGPVANPAPLLGPSITPNPLNDGELHDIQVGAINEGNAVRLVMYIDGVEIFNVLDTSEDAIRDAGYFGIRGATADEFVLEKIEAPEIAYNSLSLKGNIGVNYYTVIPDSVLEDENAFIRFTMADGEVIEKSISEGIAQVRNGVTYYVFTCQVSAKEMGDDIKAQIFYGNSLSTEENYYSVKEYAEYVLNYTADDTYDAWKPLMTAMLQYGAFAQKQFDYKTYDLVTDVSNVDLSSVTLDTLQQYKNTGAGTEKAKFYGSSLLLRSETTMSVFFQVEDGVTITVKNGTTELEVKERGGLKYVDVENISAKNLGDAFTLTVSDGTDTAEVTAYPLGYSYNVLSNAETYGEPLVSLAKALYLYHVEAKQMLGQSN